MNKRFGRRSARPAVTWSDISGQWSHVSVTATAATILVQLQSPASLAALTSDPPEDLTVLRLVGDFTVVVAPGVGNLAFNWTLALLVADVTWTPGATLATDADKRVLWHRTYASQAGTTLDTWEPPDSHLRANAAGSFMHQTDAAHLDIAPRVRIEPGKALYLVAYENVGTVGTLSTTSADMRLLYKRSGRR